MVCRLRKFSRSYKGASFTIQTFNAISEVGLKKYEAGKYKVSGDKTELGADPMAIMLRSHKLQVSYHGCHALVQRVCKSHDWTVSLL